MFLIVFSNLKLLPVKLASKFPVYKPAATNSIHSQSSEILKDFPNYALLFSRGLRKSFLPLELYKKILDSLLFIIPLIYTRHKKDETSDLLRAFIYLRNTRNKNRSWEKRN